MAVDGVAALRSPTRWTAPETRTPTTRSTSPGSRGTPWPGAAKYDVDISLDSNFATGSTTRYTTIGTSLSPTAVLENADYYWRVRAIDPASGVGDWTYGGDAAAPGDSFSESYDTQSPSINNLRMTDVTSDPGNDDDADSGDGYQTTEPIVQWDPVPGAGAYVVDVRQYDLNDPSAGCNWSGVVGQKKWLNIVEGNAWTPLGSTLGAGNTVLPGKSPTKDSITAALVVGNAYCVRVKPVRLINGVAAPWTYLDPSNDGTDWAFQYDGPPAGDVCQPSCASEDYLGADDYLTPQTGSTSTSMPLFTWNPISGAGGYFIVVATDQAMTHVIDYAWTEVPAYSPRTSSASSLISYPDSTTNYYWQVFPANGINGSGANGVAGQGDRGSFLKQTIPPTLVSPVGGETVDGQVTFQWLPVYGATRYTLQVSDDPNFPSSGSHILETLNSTYSTSYTSTLNNFKSGLLYWRVEAIDAKGTALSWTAPESFTQTYDVPTFDGDRQPDRGLGHAGAPVEPGARRHLLRRRHAVLGRAVVHRRRRDQDHGAHDAAADRRRGHRVARPGELPRWRGAERLVGDADLHAHHPRSDESDHAADVHRRPVLLGRDAGRDQVQGRDLAVEQLRDD